VPDRRTHRGPHPEDPRLFDRQSWPRLREALDDLCWLLSRGYAPLSAAKLVGDRGSLVARQRTAVERCACSDARRRRRQEHQVSAAVVRGQPLWLDGYNLLTTIEAALGGGVILAARDGCYRDMASMHGSYRRVSETAPALELIGRTMAALEIPRCRWLLDRPVSNSGRLKQLIELTAQSRGWRWEAELVLDPDPLLAACDEVVATADSAVLDQCRAWFNLAREVVVRHIPEAFLPELS
jgi:hypothetical protein